MSFNFTTNRTVEVEIQIDHISCNSCGDELEAEVQQDSFGDFQIYVTPCPKCCDREVD